MAEPAFYCCKTCRRSWQRAEWKWQRNPPPICPHCGSADQAIDQAREDAYVRQVYGPVAEALTKKPESP